MAWSGKCVYQAESSHSILSDVGPPTYVSCPSCNVAIRRTSVPLSTFMTLTTLLFWTIIDSKSLRSVLSWNTRSKPLHFVKTTVIVALTTTIGPFSFVLLFVLFVLALEGSEIESINVSEGLFMVFALGFSLERLASIQEHGISGASQGLTLPAYVSADDRFVR